MDVQIVASSLAQIQGGLSATADEIAWLQTAYLIADVVMVPMSGTLSRLLSTRILFTVAALGFTAASALCATATSLNEMILYRAMQGFCGGAITPSVWPVVYTKFRGSHLTSLMVFISIILNLSSTLGPTIGGFLTDALSWHWLFLVNIVPGIIVAAAVWLTIDIDRPEPSLLRNFDFVGMVLMAIFLGCLEYVLEEGSRWDWLDDKTIRTAMIVSGTASVFFFWRVLSYRQPIVDLRVFINRNFSLGTLFTFTMGIGMYSTTYLVPLFLAQVRGFSAWQIGETVLVAGMTQMLMSPFSSKIARTLDLRGLAKSQAAYEEAFGKLFAAFDELETRLGRQRWLVGERFTEADLRLFPTLVRFDTVYYVLFKCNQRRLTDYRNLWNYTREIYQMPGVAETVDFAKIKLGYYGGMRHINPNGILPLGPELDFTAPHDRGRH
jgi:DHA2 family multidrug resistance protein